MAGRGKCSECDSVGRLIFDLCQKHYSARSRAERAKIPCSMSNCSSGVKAAGLCERHYSRKRKHEAMEIELAVIENDKRRERQMLIKSERDRVLAILNYYKYRSDINIEQIIQEVARGSLESTNRKK